MSGEKLLSGCSVKPRERHNWSQRSAERNWKRLFENETREENRCSRTPTATGARKRKKKEGREEPGWVDIKRGDFWLDSRNSRKLRRNFQISSSSRRTQTDRTPTNVSIFSKNRRIVAQERDDDDILHTRGSLSFTLCGVSTTKPWKFSETIFFFRFLQIRRRFCGKVFRFFSAPGVDRFFFCLRFV